MPVVPAIFVGVLSAVGGSILRDVALNLPIALMHVGSLYAVAATAGTTLLVVLVAFDVNIVIAGTACVVVTTLIRLGSRALRLEPARAARARQLAGVAARLTRDAPVDGGCRERRAVVERADAAARRAAAASVARQTATTSRTFSAATLPRIARLTADTTALSDAVEMSASMPTPHSTRPSTSSST